MAVLSDQRLGDSGLGTPLGRSGLLSVWGMHTLSAAVLFLLGEADPAAALASAAAFAAVMLLTEQTDDVLSPARAWTVASCALASAGALLFVGAGEVRLLEFALCLIGMLAIRGNVVVAAYATGGGVLLVAAWAWLCDPTAAELARPIVIPSAVILLGFIARWLLSRIVRRELGHRSDAAQLALAANVAEESARRTAAELHQIRADAAPALIRLRDGVPIDAGRVQELTTAEASIRDRIRVPRLQEPLLQSAIADARSRGATVLLVGEPTDPRPMIAPELAAEIAELLGGVTGGTVTIRCLPPRRNGAISVLVDAPSGLERVTLSDDGRNLEDELPWER